MRSPFAFVFALSSAAPCAPSLACSSSPTCPPEQHAEDVATASRDYVCVPDDDTPDEVDAGAPTSETLPPPLPTSTSDAAPSSCATLPAPDDDVALVDKLEPLPAVTDATPPDGSYVLLQASSYEEDADGGASDAGPPPVTKLRAALTVAGPTLTLGAQATAGALEANESITFFFTKDQLGTVCETHAGALAFWLFPGGAGATRDAHLAWDPLRGTLRVVVGDVELVFGPG